MTHSATTTEKEAVAKMQTAPELYLLKKEVSRIVAKEHGISWKEAFDSIPDEFIGRYTYQSIAAEFLEGVQPKKKGKK